MINVEAGGHKLELATDWPDVTLGMHRQMVEATDDAALLAALTGRPVDELRRMKLGVSNAVLTQIDKLKTPPDWLSLPVPDAIVIAGKLVDLPLPFGDRIEFGQKADIDAEIKQAGDSAPLEQVARTILIILLAPIVTGTPYDMYDANVAEVVGPYVDQMPVLDAMPLAAFFLLNRSNCPYSGTIKYTPVMKPKTSNWQRWRLRLRRVWKTTTRFTT